MRKVLKTTMLLVLLLLGVASRADAQVSFGVRIGPPPAPRFVRVRPSRPGPNFVWIDGYWYPVGNRYQWHNGYWTRPPYGGAVWVGPRHDGREFYQGYWSGNRGRFDHNHRWDRNRNRDFRRGDRR